MGERAFKSTPAYQAAALLISQTKALKEKTQNTIDEANELTKDWDIASQ